MSPLRPFRRRRAAPTPPLVCREVVELVTNYLEGALSERDRARFEAHLTGCEHCTTYVEQLRSTIDLLGEVPPGTLSPEAERDLLQTFRDFRREEEGG